MPNAALFLWPLVSIGLFAGFGVKRGLVLSVLIGYLFLPASIRINLPGLPPYSKSTAIAAGLVLAYALFARRRREATQDLVLANRTFGWLLAGLFLLLAVITPFMTYRTNPETLVFGATVLPGLKPWDMVGRIWNVTMFFVPYYMAGRILVTRDDHRMLLRTLVGTGLVYSLFVLVEVRMSPQFSSWVYGYFPHSFIQHVRDGSYRPLVFLQHGLWLGFFLFGTIVASVALSRSEKPAQRVMFMLAGAWLLVVLLLSRNLGATMLAVVIAPVMLMLTRGTQIRLAAAAALLLLLYPAVRQADVLPIDRFLSFVQTISVDRAASLEFRLDQEQELLARAMQKPLFGWGSQGRNRLYDKRGKDIAVTDGGWIIALGVRGWVGYIAYFGLLTAPVLWLGRVRRRKEVSPATIGLALIMAGNFIYLIPNSTLSPIGFLILGALSGFVRFDPASAATDDPAAEGPDGRRGLRYSRFDGPEVTPEPSVAGVRPRVQGERSQI